MKLAFVILNYGTYQETTECVSSIQEHVDVAESEYNITIVDNGSADGSGEKLCSFYGNTENIDVLLSGENLGFARGNNLGMAHVKKLYGPEFTVVLNSDTELFQNDLYAKLSKEYRRSNFGLLGPMMCIACGRCDDSPWEPISLEVVNKRLKSYEKEKKKIKAGLILFDRIVNAFQRKVLGLAWQDTFHKHLDYWRYQTDVELQGAFLVFSRELLSKIDGFDSRTFLYYEEQLLYIMVKRAGMPIVYDPEIAVYHKDGRSVKRIRTGNKAKLLFINQCNIDSLKYLRDELAGMAGNVRN